MFSRVQLQQRYVLCLLIFTGLVTNYMLRINMSIAIVTMSGRRSPDIILFREAKYLTWISL